MWLGTWRHDFVAIWRHILIVHLTDLDSGKVTLQAVSHNNGPVREQTEQYCLHISQCGRHVTQIFFCDTTEPTSHNIFKFK